ncbi:hypothetical protein HS041_19935 [Planomonospora sp. ID67723]|uniref:hypothetical protein n=1 Tax=Planomonospora sp. ID67723 TaxID=2738134 RepID=UPI0018C36620|nr:hypothetical protein [Planomonospora sp. ID67723]MBG0830041.1 hypothetical protein [Planomonospora sp. ID67723]
MPALRLLRATAFAVVCVLMSLGMHVLAGGAAVDPAVLAAAVTPVGAGAFVLARRQQGLGVLLTAAFATQYGLHHVFSAAAAAAQPPVPAHGHGGLAADVAMLLAHAVTALLSAYWLERGESALATLLRLLVASVLILLVWRAPAAGHVTRPITEQDGPSFLSRLLAAAVSRRGPPVGFSAI